jgi:hypothetical protein
LQFNHRIGGAGLEHGFVCAVELTLGTASSSGIACISVSSA